MNPATLESVMQQQFNASNARLLCSPKDAGREVIMISQQT